MTVNWRIRDRTIEIGERGILMGVLNVTPDSFSDGGAFTDPNEALEHCHRMIEAGAEIIDVGGESTRPGAPPVAEAVELERVLPVIERIAAREDCMLSIDTSKARVAEAALAAGAQIVNDVTGLRGDLRMPEVCARHRAGVVLMHMKGTPRTMQTDPHYDDVVGEVRTQLERRRDAAVEAGIDRRALAYDPGIGFGKTVRHNLQLLRNAAAFAVDDQPVLIGFSRKSFIGKVLGEPELERRQWPSVALTALCRQLGAHIIRVHDVAECHDALRVCESAMR